MSFGVSNAIPSNQGAIAFAYKRLRSAMFDPDQVSAACELFVHLYQKTCLRLAHRECLYKTNAILLILTLSITIGHRHADRT